MAYGHSIEHRNGGTVHLEPAIDEWYGKTFAALGDSIVWAGAPMLNRMRSRLGFSAYRNLGVSGRPMADGTANGAGTVTTALANNFTTDAMVYVAAGTNDFRLDVPLGTIGTLAQTSHSRSTFYGAYRTTIDHLLAQNPGIQIVLATPLQRNNKSYSTTSTNTAGHMLRDYRSAIFALGDMYSLPVVDLYALSGISEKTLDLYTSDGLHPNEQGYVQMARVVVGQLRSGGAASGVPELEGRVAALDTPIRMGLDSLNSLIEPCTFYQDIDARATTENNYPVTWGGWGVVRRWSPNYNGLIQFYYPRAGGGYRRQLYNGSWGPWTNLLGGPISPTGEASSTYDSGWRRLAVPAGITGDVIVTRSGPVVTLAFSNVRGIGGSYTIPDHLPAGIRPRLSIATPIPAGGTVTVNYAGVISVANVPSDTTWCTTVMTYVPGVLTIPTTLPGTPA